MNARNLTRSMLAIVSAFGLTVLASAQVNNPVINPDGTLNKVAGIGLSQKLGENVPLDTQFKDESGQTVLLSQYFGRRPVLLNLIFYKCPGMCSLELEGLVASLTKMSRPGSTHAVLGKDIEVVSISIDPNEGPELAAAKHATVAQNFDTPTEKAGWHFLTGDLKNLNRLCTSVGFAYTYNKDTKAINHPAGIMLLSPSGKVSQYFYGTGYPEKPLHDAIVSAQNEKVGHPAEVYLLGCLSHDAMTGKYTVNVERTLTVLCGITLITLVGGIIRMSVKSKTKPVGPNGPGSKIAV